MTLGVSALSQLLAVRGRFAVPAGLAVLGTSVLLLASAAAWRSVALLVASSVCAGLGQGVAVRTVFNDVAAKVEVSQHAQVVSTVYVITYLGSAVPVIGLGWATAAFGLEAAVMAFVTVCCAAAMALAVVTFRTALQRQRQEREGLDRQRSVITLDVLEDEGGFGVAHNGVGGQVVQDPVPQVLGASDGDVQQVVHGP
jgi:hypothetical protein